MFIKELCTAIPNDEENDDSIRAGFSWLIGMIEKNYAELNARVNNAKNPRQAKPAEKKNE